MSWGHRAPRLPVWKVPEHRFLARPVTWKDPPPPRCDGVSKLKDGVGARRGRARGAGSLLHVLRCCLVQGKDLGCGGQTSKPVAFVIRGRGSTPRGEVAGRKLPPTPRRPQDHTPHPIHQELSLHFGLPRELIPPPITGLNPASKCATLPPGPGLVSSLT